MQLGNLTSVLRPKWTTPKELGIDFPEIKRIFYTQGCGSEKTDWHYSSSSRYPTGMGAHTHLCPTDPLYHSICFSHEEEILNYDGSPSDCLWHEYGHVLWKIPDSIKNFRCVGPNSMHAWETEGDSKDFMANDGHDSQWKSIMISLGKPHLISRYVSPSIKLAQAAAMVK